MSAARPEGPGDFAECGSRIENVLHHILGHVQVDAFVRERELFDILTPETLMLPARTDAREVLCRRVIPALGPKARTGSAKHRRAFVDCQISPGREEMLDCPHQRPLARNGSAIGTDVVIAKPGLACLEDNGFGAAGADTAICEDHLTGAYATARYGLGPRTTTPNGEQSRVHSVLCGHPAHHLFPQHGSSLR